MMDRATRDLIRSRLVEGLEFVGREPAGPEGWLQGWRWGHQVMLTLFLDWEEWASGTPKFLETAFRQLEEGESLRRGPGLPGKRRAAGLDPWMRGWLQSYRELESLLLQRERTLWVQGDLEALYKLLGRKVLSPKDWTGLNTRAHLETWEPFLRERRWMGLSAEDREKVKGVVRVSLRGGGE